MPPKKDNFQRRGQATVMQNNTGQKIRLRRNTNKQAMIQQNLSHMEQQAQKKKIAQEFYYKNKVGQSPMRRGGQDLGNGSKAPVHNRLGRKIRLKQPTITTREDSTPQLQPARNRIRLQRVRPRQPIVEHLSFPQNTTDKFLRLYSAQNRLLRIRQGAALVQKGIVQRGNLQRGVVQRAMVQPSLPNPRIHLRRNRPQTARAVNYMVQIANNAVVKNRKHHVSSQLNPTLQQEIRMIQNKSASQSLVSAEAVQFVGFGVTSKSLNERFSEL